MLLHKNSNSSNMFKTYVNIFAVNVFLKSLRRFKTERWMYFTIYLLVSYKKEHFKTSHNFKMVLHRATLKLSFTQNIMQVLCRFCTNSENFIFGVKRIEKHILKNFPLYHVNSKCTKTYKKIKTSTYTYTNRHILMKSLLDHTISSCQWLLTTCK